MRTEGGALSGYNAGEMSKFFWEETLRVLSGGRVPVCDGAVNVFNKLHHNYILLALSGLERNR